MMTPSFWHDPQSKMARVFAPLGMFYGYASRLWSQRQTLEKLDIPVICVGNLVSGGAGKTPVAMMIARELLARGKKVHFLSRGYGGYLKGPVRVDHHSFQEVGDEPLILAKIAPVWVAKDRRAGGRAAVQAGADIIILDDGHQNFSLHKDFSLVVIDTDYKFGNGRLFPAGPLREPISRGLGRAQGLVLVGEGEIPVNVFLPFVRVRFDPCTRDLEALRSRTLIPFAGIGRPQKFFRMLETYAIIYGFKILESVAFPDHYAYSQKDMEKLRDKAKRAGAILVTTEKDFMRLSLREGIYREGIYKVDLAPEIVEGSWDDLWKGTQFIR